MYISNVKITNCVYLLIVYNTVRGIKFAPIHVLNDTVNVKKNVIIYVIVQTNAIYEFMNH